MNIEEKMHQLQNEIEDAKMELNRSRQREKMSEEHNIRLTQTVDKLLSESNERLQVHLNERMNSLEEKNSLTQEGEKLKKQIEELESERDKAYIEIEKLKLDMETNRKESQNLQSKMKELSTQYTNALNLNNSLSTTINNINKNVTINNKMNGNNNPNMVNNEFNQQQQNGQFYTDQVNSAENGMNSLDLNGLTNSIYLSQQQLQQQQLQHIASTLPSNNNKSPSFSVNSLKGRSRSQYGSVQANKLINEQNRMQQFLNDPAMQEGAGKSI